MATDSFLAYAVSCSLVDLLDHTLLVQLRDGRKIIGELMYTLSISSQPL